MKPNLVPFVRFRFLFTALVVILLAAASGAVAAAEDGLEGHWEGAIELPGQKLEVKLDFTAADGDWSGDISIPAQGARDLPLTGIQVDGEQVVFVITGVPGEPTFTGTMAADAASISGDFTQSGQTFPFTLTSGEDVAGKAAAVLADLREIIEPALDDWKAPGLALAVVAGDQVVLAEGYGYRDLENKVPMTSATLLAIGSSTKAFTTFLLGLLVDEGKLEWDEPVASYLPGFALHDEYATAHLTPRDMVTHRSGLPRHDLSWYNNEEITRAEIVQRLRHLQPNKELREVWQYNNLMFLTAGYLVEQLTGMSWEEAVRSKIFAPLGMQRSNLSVDASRADDDHALPYIEDDDELRQVAFRPINVMGPAGSINSSAEEMARWVRLHLGGGQIEGRPVIAPGTLTEMHSPQMVIPGLPDEPEESPVAYAFGWFVETWRGHFKVHHGGNIDGFSALVTLFPNDDFGVVVLVNKNGSALPSLLTKTIADRVLGLETRDWLGEAAEKRDAAKDFVEQGQENKDLYRVKKTRPTRKLDEYAGEYEHPGYGVLEIVSEGKDLTLIYNSMSMPLQHWHYDVFNVAESDEEIIPEDLKVSFVTDARGRVSTVSLPLELLVDPIVFERLPDARLKDPEYLARLAGNYEVPGQTITFSVKGEVLVLQVTGQPSVELVPAGTDEFTLEGITGFAIKFTVGEAGPATEAVFIQPNGVFPARRVEEEGGEEG